MKSIEKAAENAKEKVLKLNQQKIDLIKKHEISLKKIDEKNEVIKQQFLKESGLKFGDLIEIHFFKYEEPQISLFVKDHTLVAYLSDLSIYTENYDDENVFIAHVHPKIKINTKSGKLSKKEFHQNFFLPHEIKKAPANAKIAIQSWDIPFYTQPSY